MLYLHVGPYTCAYCTLCMKVHCYFLLNIKHGASQFYWGARQIQLRPRREGVEGLFRGLSGAPGEGPL